jgi:ABC-type transport system substrate-binding protein
MNRLRKALVGTALVGSTIAGGALGATLILPAGVDDATTSTSTAAAATTTDPVTNPTAHPVRDPSLGGHMANGVTETLLTGDVKTQVEAAALAAVPGGRIERVENDAEGDVYEAHVVKADGSHVTVKLDASFVVTATEAGR